MRYIILILSLIAFIGCASYGREIRQTSVDSIQKGVTTKQEIINAFGQPDGTYFDKENRLIMYYYAGKIKQSGWNFVPIVGLIHSEVKMQNQMLTIVLNKDNIVEEYSFTNPDKIITSGIVP